MATEHVEDTTNSPKSLGGKWPVSPRVVVELLDLAEIEERWGFTEYRVYRAVARGLIHAYGRPGRQKYYSFAELTAAFGEPPNGPFRPARTEKTDKGGNQQGFDFGESVDAEAA